MIMDIRQLQFTNWITSNYEVLKNKLKNSYILDEDFLHDTLLEVMENIVDHKFNMSDVENFIMDSYKKSFHKRQFDNKKTICSEESAIDNFNYSKNNTISSRENYDQVSKDIVKQVRHILSVDDYGLFSLYVTNDSLSINQMSAYTGIPSTTLYRKLRNIKQTIINQLKSTLWN